jgi:hypothetical protein
MTNQTTILFLSECLATINSYKKIGPRKSILVQKADSKNQSAVVISSDDLPSLEVSSVLHILCGILSSGVTLELAILSDVVLAALRIFYKIAIHQHCPPCVQKAYIFLILTLINPDRAVYDSVGPTIKSELIGTLSVCLSKFNGPPLISGKFLIE